MEGAGPPAPLFNNRLRPLLVRFDHAAELIKGLKQTTRDGVRELVSEAMSNGWSNNKLADELEDAWEFSPERAEMIARSETAMADLHGNNELAKEAGIAEIGFLAAPGCCDDCDALDGEIAPIDGAFSDGTPVDDLVHPQDRCDRVAVLPENQEGLDE